MKERPAREAGLTLVEMLVVLAIVGVMAGAVVLAVGRSGSGGAQAEARRLASRLSLAAADAMVADEPIALDWDKQGYRFLAWDGRRWAESKAQALEAHRLPAGLTLEAEGRHPVPIGADAGGAQLDMAVTGKAGRWRVRFDGMSAAVEAAAQP